MDTTVWLHEMTWEEVKTATTAARGTIIIPVGSTEQHGPHLPVGTDTLVALTLAEDAARQTGVPVAPPLWFGWSPHHLVLPGTITIRAEVLIELASDIVGSLSRHGFDKFVFVNGHRIVNVTWLQIVGERVKRELGVTAVIFDPAYMSKSIVKEMGWGAVGHAEEIEGSHMWYRYPELVKMDRAVDNPHPPRELYSVDPAYAGDTLCYVPSNEKEMAPQVTAAGGTTGTPSKATRDGGKCYHEHLVERLAAVIRTLQQPTAG
ncbi:MAG: creatininase family protein [Pseudomonadota bacterium]